ncbi:NfeD family protein [Peribacillus kribbensis]|uniref:NfeD family protein n=1 Tax=Peribacillus kribbensis TaxID=356658 RepID=UPI000403F7C5|nr:NfeD family protein [Peribacillus kribbensis]
MNKYMLAFLLGLFSWLTLFGLTPEAAENKTVYKVHVNRSMENEKELLEQLGIEKAKAATVKESFAEKASRFLTNPVVICILLTIGCLGLVIELFTPGIGLGGLLGLIVFVLFFFGHMAAGLTGYEPIVLFGAGAVLLILELFLPGAVAGMLGLGCIIASLYMASESALYLSIGLLIALVISISTAIILIKVYGKRMRFFKKIVLEDSTASDKGYVSNNNRVDLIGSEGTALTTLRPAGIALIENERLDVVTEGGFIPKDSRIKVVKAEGARIVVREI